jgi:hypothetical protein
MIHTHALISQSVLVVHHPTCQLQAHSAVYCALHCCVCALAFAQPKEEAASCRTSLQALKVDHRYNTNLANLYIQKNRQLQGKLNVTEVQVLLAIAIVSSRARCGVLAR